MLLMGSSLTRLRVAHRRRWRRKRPRKRRKLQLTWKVAMTMRNRTFNFYDLKSLEPMSVIIGTSCVWHSVHFFAFILI